MYKINAMSIKQSTTLHCYGYNGMHKCVVDKGLPCYQY